MYLFMCRYSLLGGFYHPSLSFSVSVGPDTGTFGVSRRFITLVLFWILFWRFIWIMHLVGADTAVQITSVLDLSLVHIMSCCLGQVLGGVRHLCPISYFWWLQTASFLGLLFGASGSRHLHMLVYIGSSFRMGSDHFSAAVMISSPFRVHSVIYYMSLLQLACGFSRHSGSGGRLL